MNKNMKKAIFYIVFSVTSILPFMASAAFSGTTDTTLPVVIVESVGGLNPAADGLVPAVFHGNVKVYATVNDDNIENYHFRIVKNTEPIAWGSDVCTATGTLFAAENQGYASTTLGHSACGFVYNQSVYVSSSFTNESIATINTDDIAAFGGDGEYLLILAARDTSGNRSRTFVEDVSARIVIDSNAPLTDATNTDNTVVPPRRHSSRKPASITESQATTTAATSTASVQDLTKLTKIGASAANTGLLTAIAATTTPAGTSTAEAQSQLASVGFANMLGSWEWFIAAALLLALLWYFTFYRNYRK